jgi:2-dehydro-3-deoxygluconokinase
MKTVTFGEIMLRLTPPGFQRFTQASSFDAAYSGGEANVAVSLFNFGEEFEYVARLPKNELGDACLMCLHSYGIHTDHSVCGVSELGFTS